MLVSKITAMLVDKILFYKVYLFFLKKIRTNFRTASASTAGCAVIISKLEKEEESTKFLPVLMEDLLKELNRENIESASIIATLRDSNRKLERELARVKDELELQAARCAGLEFQIAEIQRALSTQRQLFDDSSAELQEINASATHLQVLLGAERNKREDAEARLRLALDTVASLESGLQLQTAQCTCSCVGNQDRFDNGERAQMTALNLELRAARDELLYAQRENCCLSQRLTVVEQEKFTSQLHDREQDVHAVLLAHQSESEALETLDATRNEHYEYKQGVYSTAAALCLALYFATLLAWAFDI
jgi:hypothetical protein